VSAQLAHATGLDDTLTAKIEPFDSFWEAPPDIEKGYESVGTFYRHNYLPLLPRDRSVRILVISCGPGYFVNLLREECYDSVLGIDSFPDKIAHAQRHGLNCRVARAFGFLDANRQPYDVIIAEQEINHLTKLEILQFLGLCHANLVDDGILVVHGVNGAHPVVGSESRWGNFDHYNAWTQYSLQQVLDHGGFADIRVFGLNLYVFYRNPLNYVAWLWDRLNTLFFRFSFMMVGKSNRLFTKKIAAVARKRAAA